jgi:hypothetical protein
MNIPKGRHEIRLRFLNTLPRRIAFLISVLAALQAVYLFVWRRLRARVSKCCARGR